VKRILAAGMAAAVVMVLVVGAALAVEGRLGTRSVPRPGHDPKSSADFGHVPMSRAQGMMPEVVVAAEMPRLVMPTVEVQALRTVAGLGTQSQFLGGIGSCPASGLGN